MADPIITFLIGALTIAVAAIFLTHCSDTIARLTRFGHMLVGSVLLAAATSLPELTVDLNAIYQGMPNIAVGGLVGSSLFNLLILAVADFFHRSRGVLFSRKALPHVLAGSVTIMLTAIVGVAIFVESIFKDVQFLELGVGAIAVFFGYLFGVRLIYCDQPKLDEVEEEFETIKNKETKFELYRAIVGFILATAAIFIVSPYLAESAGEIAKLSGLGETFIGTTLVALSTSLPELIATITAVRMNSVDLAIGNIFGSNAFNMLLLIPLDLAYEGSLLSAASQTHILTCFAVVTVTSIVLLGQLYRVEKRKFFIEPDASLVIVLAIGFLWLIFLCR